MIDEGFFPEERKKMSNIHMAFFIFGSGFLFGCGLMVAVRLFR